MSLFWCSTLFAVFEKQTRQEWILYRGSLAITGGGHPEPWSTPPFSVFEIQKSQKQLVQGLQPFSGSGEKKFFFLFCGFVLSRLVSWTRICLPLAWPLRTTPIDRYARLFCFLFARCSCHRTAELGRWRSTMLVVSKPRWVREREIPFSKKHRFLFLLSKRNHPRLTPTFAASSATIWACTKLLMKSWRGGETSCVRFDYTNENHFLFYFAALSFFSVSLFPKHCWVVYWIRYWGDGIGFLFYYAV